MDTKAFEAFLNRHEVVALQFSAGKDSAACLKLIEPWLDRVVILWANSGNAYPETTAYMDEIYSKVPHFVEVLGEQPSWTLLYGMPVDVMPVSASSFSSQMHGREVPLLQPFNQCCGHNLWEPMAKWMMQAGVTGLIRGQKNCDSLSPPYKSGDVLGGIEFFHPIEDWSNEQVFNYLGNSVPDSYKRGLPSSLDCMNCTAYVSENKGRLADLELIYPPAAASIRKVHKFLKEELSSHLNDLEV